jgi:hypothetical protein
MTGRLIIAATLGCVLLGAGGALADTQVQLRSFVAPVKPANPAAKKEAPITVRFAVANSDNAFAVCELAPRLRDSLMETLYSNPIPVSAQNVMDVKKVEPILLDAANKSLRQNLLLGIQVIPGAQDLVTGSSRSRAAAIGCGEVGADGAKAAPKTTAH